MSQFFSLDDSEREHDWVLYQKLTRDICYLYHELSGYVGIMGDLAYGHFELQYWDLINRLDTGDADDRFLRSGILVLFVAMLFDEFDGSGISISPDAMKVRQALAEFVPEDEEMQRLADIVLDGLNQRQVLSPGEPPSEKFLDDALWIRETFVAEYFRTRR